MRNLEIVALTLFECVAICSLLVSQENTSLERAALVSSLMTTEFDRITLPVGFRGQNV